MLLAIRSLFFFLECWYFKRILGFLKNYVRRAIEVSIRIELSGHFNNIYSSHLWRVNFSTYLLFFNVFHQDLTVFFLCMDVSVPCLSLFLCTLFFSCYCKWICFVWHMNVWGNIDLCISCLWYFLVSIYKECIFSSLHFELLCALKSGMSLL